MSPGAEDFFARAQALGLKLSRADYERTRAGVAAFLRAERVANDAPEPSAPGAPDVCASPSEPEEAQSTRARSRFARSTSGQPNFFSMPAAAAAAAADDARARRSLDAVGSAVERRRRRQRRQRMLEKLEQRENGSVAASSRASSEVSDVLGDDEPDDPMPADMSGDISADPETDAPASLGTPVRRCSTPPPVGRAARAEALLTPTRRASSMEPATASTPTAPVAAADVPLLNLRARVSAAGKLWLAPAAPIAADKSVVVAPGGSSPAVADDSGVFVDEAADASDSSLLGWGPRPRTPRRSISAASAASLGTSGSGAGAAGTTDGLNACMDRMSLLDRIMMTKTSPRRIRREARARARSVEQGAGDRSEDAEAPGTPAEEFLNDTPTKDTSPAEPHLAAPASASRATHSARQHSVSVRWTHGVATPFGHSRMTTQERYDLVLYGVPQAPERGDDESPPRGATPVPRSETPAVTPLRPGGNAEGAAASANPYMHCRTTSITSVISPGVLTPWTHTRGISAGGFANLTTSPLFSTDAAPSSSAGGSGGRVAWASTSLGDADASFSPQWSGSEFYALPTAGVTYGQSPGRLLYVDSFPGKSPLAGDGASPLRRAGKRAAAAASPLASKTAAAAARSPGSPGGESSLQAAAAHRLDLVHRLAPSWGSPTKAGASLWSHKLSPRKQDTISPADIFQNVGTVPSTSSVRLEGAASTEDSASDSDSSESSADEREVAMLTSAASASPARSRDGRHAAAGSGSDASEPRNTRRRSSLLRSASASGAPSAPARGGDDVFAPPGAGVRPAAGSDPRQSSWEQSDGSCIVKLVSEELQAAIDSGALELEPEPRYYRLPPGYGSSKEKPSSVSYAGLIGQAILSSSDGRLSLAEIYNWISTVYPFYERGDRGWQNSIRHNLSLNKSFVKLERESTIPGKGGWWAIASGHEERFRNGLYVPGASRSESGAEPRSFRASHSAPSAVLGEETKRSDADTGKRSKRRAAPAADPPVPRRDAEDEKAFKRPRTRARETPTPRAPPPAQVQPTPRGAQPFGPTPVRSSALREASSVYRSHHSQGVPMLTDSASSPPTSPLASFVPYTGAGGERGERVPHVPPHGSRGSPNEDSSMMTPSRPYAPRIGSMPLDMGQENFGMVPRPLGKPGAISPYAPALSHLAEYNQMQVALAPGGNGDGDGPGIGGGIPTPNDAQRIASVGLPLTQSMLPSPTKRFGHNVSVQQSIHGLPMSSMSYAYQALPAYLQGGFNTSMFAPGPPPENASVPRQLGWADDACDTHGSDAGSYVPMLPGHSSGASPSRAAWPSTVHRG